MVQINGRRYLRAAITPAIAPVIVALAAERDAYRAALLRTQAELFELLAEVKALKAAMALRQRSDVERVARMHEIQQAMGVQRDPAQPLQ
jgi:hypothetical protein